MVSLGIFLVATVVYGTTLVRSQTAVCYSSLDCHGNTLNVVVPEKSEQASFIPSECCSGTVRGLSYRQIEEEQCINCYTNDNFESYGNKFYLALFGNFQPQTNFVRIGKVRLSVSPVTEEVSSFTVERQGKEKKYTAPCEVEYKSEDVNLDSIKTRDQSIIIRSENGDAFSVVAFAEEYSSSDTFRVMPCVRLPDIGYEYYAVSVPKASLKLEFGDLDIIADVEGKSAIVIVTTEDNTDISISLTQNITDVDANDIMSQIGGGDTLSAGVEYTFKLSQSKQTLYLASEDDLTGSRVVSSKPIAFISGHECGTVPFNFFYCDQLVEQLPPSATWGKMFISAPIEGRSAVDIFRVVASRDNTILRSSCFQGNIITLNAGQFREFNVSSSSYCYYESTQPLLMVQFSVASGLDNVLAGDPFMVVVPPVEQYRNSYDISTFVSSDETNPGTNYINILIPAESGSPQDILFDGQSLSSSVQFVEIPCVFSEEVCAYAAQMNTTAVSHVLNTSDPSVVVNAIVYWLAFRVGHGYFAGMTQDPIALPKISLDQEKYEVFEILNSTLAITIVRTGDLTQPITVHLTAVPVAMDNATLVDDNLFTITKEVNVSGPSTVILIELIDDEFPEGSEQFEVFLSAAPGALIVSPAYAMVTILNEDHPLPVMNISFVATDIDAIEVERDIKLTLKKTEGAIGPVSVRLYTEEGTAIDGEDFIGINDTLTFGVDETEMEVIVVILDNEEVEQFTVKIEAIEGIFPVAVANSTATVRIADNDVAVIGFSQFDYTTSENMESVKVKVEVMFGRLERSVAVWVNSTQQSTATPGRDFEIVSRMLTFDSIHSTGVVSIRIFDDVEREVINETVHLQLSFVEEDANNNILLFHNQTIVSIVDDDEVIVGMMSIRGTVREEEGSALANISILQGSLGDASISFIVSTANGTAQSNTDYEQREEIITLSDLNPFEELLFPVIDDNEYEGPNNEMFFVQVQLDPNGQNSERVKIASGLAKITLNIIDNEVRPVASIGFIKHTWMVSEGAEEVVLLLGSDGKNVDPVDVFYAFLNGSETAEAGLDYLNGGDVGTLRFAPGATVAAITVPIIDDVSVESTEFFKVSLLPAEHVTLTVDEATVTIKDNDAVIVQFNMISYTTSEAAAYVEVTIQISNATETVQLNVNTVDGTAQAGLDYVYREVQLIFSPGDLEKTFTVSVIDDRIQEDSELFFVTLHSPVSNLKVELPQTNAAIFVMDDDKIGNLLLGTCRASADCRETSGDVIAMTTLEDCCLNTVGLAFVMSGSKTCTPCIVFGFFQDSFTGIEQGPGHTVQAGWQKGAAQAGVNLIFNVISTGLTAREGYDFDYTINTIRVKFLQHKPDPPDKVVFKFRIDAIAQESNETLMLELVRAPGSAELPIGDGVFFRNNITMTIIDSDAVNIFFAQESYEANEAPEDGAGSTSFMPVRVIKTSRIANPIVLEVVPLTVDELRAHSPPTIPCNIPEDNPFSPRFADVKDFDSTVIRITFDPDEDTNLNNDERVVRINIFDDLVNEAYEQVFIVQLRLVSSTNSSTIDLATRVASICRITDDDPIRIGFEQSQYTYIETTIDNIGQTYPVYLAKEDNVLSEQTFVIVIQVSDSVPVGSGFNPALLNSDYELGVVGTAPVVHFSPRDQKTLFSFTLLSDSFPEGTEAFLASIGHENSAVVDGVTYDVPLPLPPIKLFPETFIIIEDDDPIIIGFNETQYTVRESIGMLNVYVAVFNPPEDRELFTAIDLVIQAISTNATAGVDYEKLNANDSDVTIRFDEDNRQLSFQVTIIDDELLESTENFDLELKFDPSVSLPTDVLLKPNMTMVYILDNDSN